MGELFSITLVSGIILLCLYLPYKLLLARKRQHRFNRIVIFCMYLTAVLVPLLNRIPFRVRESLESGVATAVGDITVGPLTGGIIEPVTPLWTRVLLWVYIVGVVCTLLKFIWSYIRLVHIIRNGRKEPRNGYTLVIVDNNRISPFSWQKYVVIGNPTEAEESGAVMIHEMRHLAAGHSTDILLAQLYAIFVWYNPVSWLTIDELKTVHEYEADEAVMESGVNLKEYQMLLIKKTAGARLPSLANSLNHSKLQKRITMMYQSKSKFAGKLGSLVLIPAFAVSMVVVTIPAVASIITDASEATLVESGNKVNKSFDNPQTAEIPSAHETHVATPSYAEVENDNSVPADSEATASSSASTEATAKSEATAEPAKESRREVFVAVEKQAEFPGGMQAMMKWLKNNIRYPEDAFKNDIQGRVIIKFIVNADGSISDATVVKGISPSLDNEAIRVTMAMPKWEAGEVNGNKVASFFTLPVNFRLSTPAPKDSIQ